MAFQSYNWPESHYSKQPSHSLHAEKQALRINVWRITGYKAFGICTHNGCKPSVFPGPVHATH